jgi:hypothetical protein
VLSDCVAGESELGISLQSRVRRGYQTFSKSLHTAFSCDAIDDIILARAMKMFQEKKTSSIHTCATAVSQWR